MAKDDYTGYLILAGIAAGGYLLYRNGTLASWFPSFFGATSPTTTPTTTSTSTSSSTTNQPPPATPTPCQPVHYTCPDGTVLTQTGQGGNCMLGPWNCPTPAPPPPNLTVADAATLPYSTQITAAQMQSVHDALVTELQGGQIALIAGNSVLAYMLGWGGQASGATEQVVGETYTFDGTNWNLSTGSSSGSGTSGADPCSTVDPSFLASLKQLSQSGRAATIKLYPSLPPACVTELSALSGLGYRNGRIPIRAIHRGGGFRLRSA